MAVAQLKHHSEHNAEPIRRSRSLSGDHLFMFAFLFAVAMFYVGLFAASHATVDRMNRTRENTASLQKKIELSNGMLAHNTSSVVLERWALQAGFQSTPGTVYVTRPAHASSSKPARDAGSPRDPFYARSGH